jgi:NosR/NirI family nitrous oxide reductase transcriptional regulator
LGAFMGLVIGLRLLTLATRRRRVDYEPNRGECVSCARCFRHCPKESKRLRKERA